MYGLPLAMMRGAAEKAPIVPMRSPRTTGVWPRNFQPSQMVLATDGAEMWPRSLRFGICRKNTVSAETPKVAALKYRARFTWLVLKYGEIEPSTVLTRASVLNRMPARTALP